VLQTHLSPEENELFLNILTNMIDHDKNGQIGYSEFTDMCISRQNLLSRENLIKAFRQINADNSGLISIKELKAALDAS
jgi:Ca2+-binding EF-hand superfamily protein